jgi:hypothetical protein
VYEMAMSAEATKALIDLVRLLWVFSKSLCNRLIDHVGRCSIVDECIGDLSPTDSMERRKSGQKLSVPNSALLELSRSSFQRMGR